MEERAITGVTSAPRVKRKLLISLSVVIIIFVVGVWLTGSILSAPARQSIGEAPRDSAAEDAGHIDLYTVKSTEYERRVLSFFSVHLKSP